MIVILVFLLLPSYQEEGRFLTNYSRSANDDIIEKVIKGKFDEEGVPIFKFGINAFNHQL